MNPNQTAAAGSVSLIHAPSFAGGRLILLNRLLRAFASGMSVRLVLDDNLTCAQDLRLPIQNPYGDVVFVAIPDHGKLGHGSRAAISNALMDSLPQTAEVADALDLLLPEALQTPLEAARQLWSTIMPQLYIECIPRGDPSPPEAQQNTMLHAGITWLDKRHRAAMKELGLPMRVVLEGEAACKKYLTPVPAGELGACVEELQADQERHFTKLRSLAEEVDARLLGSWLRMRRDMRSALEVFAERADRSGRNRVGIRNARLHALAQAMRPHDTSQELGLSLMTAIASFQWNYRDFSHYLTTLYGCVVEENVQIPT